MHRTPQRRVGTRQYLRQALAMAIHRRTQQHGMFRRIAGFIQRKQSTCVHFARDIFDGVRVWHQQRKVGTVQAPYQARFVRTGRLDRMNHVPEQNIGGFATQLLIKLNDVGQTHDE